MARAGREWPKHAWYALAALEVSGTKQQAFLLGIAEAAAAQKNPYPRAIRTLVTAAADADDAVLLRKLLASPAQLLDEGWMLCKCGEDATKRNSFEVASLLLERALDARGFDQPGSLLLHVHGCRLDEGSADPKACRRSWAGSASSGGSTSGTPV